MNEPGRGLSCHWPDCPHGDECVHASRISESQGLNSGRLRLCRLCGRIGSRGFTTLFGTDDGDNGYRCSSVAACERRQS